MTTSEQDTTDGKPEARLQFATKLRAVRIAKGFRTARSLARALGIDENRYTRYERAEVEPDLALIRKMCDILTISPTDLLSPGSESALGLGTQPSDQNARTNNYGHGGNLPGGVLLAGHRDHNVLAWALSGLVAKVRLAHSNEAAEAVESSFRSEAMRVFLALEHQTVDTLRRIAADPAVLASEPGIIRQIVHLSELIGEALDRN